MTTTDDAMSGKAGGNSFCVILVLAIAAFFLIAVHQHLFNVNSHYYYTWKWQWIPSNTVYPLLIPLAIPFFLGQMVYLRRPQLVWLALAAVHDLDVRADDCRRVPYRIIRQASLGFRMSSGADGQRVFSRKRLHCGTAV